MSEKIAVVGLGYVGLPLAACLSREFDVVGFDIDTVRIDELNRGYDRSRQMSGDDIASNALEFRSDPACLESVDVVIVTVPTPVDDHNRPDLRPLLGAAKLVGENFKTGAIVVFESTVYPGVTEEECVPVLEKASGKKWKQDFHIGYSPERVNPADAEHSIDRIVKVVAGDTPEISKKLEAIYGKVVTAGIHVADSIRTAEAAKVIENCQRDINIAFVNELAIIFQRLGLDTDSVLAAAGTKWNFLPFRPGLVGGHCIGVDPYYLTHKAESVGYHPQVILSGRRINDGMGVFVANRVIKLLIAKGSKIRDAEVLILGVTFKENCGDVRNSRVFDIVRELQEFGMAVDVYDPVAETSGLAEKYSMGILDEADFQKAKGRYSAVILAVAHDEFRGIDVREWVEDEGVVYDVKSVLPHDQIDERL